MSAEAQLAGQQLALVRALTGGGPPPPGFDAARVRTVARSLVVKRLCAVRRVWPGLARGLGADFDRVFTDYATVTPAPRDGGPLADGNAFATTLKAARALPDEARLQRLAVSLDYRRTPNGLVRRSPWAVVVRATIVRRWHVVIGVRLFGRTIVC